MARKFHLKSYLIFLPWLALSQWPILLPPPPPPLFNPLLVNGLIARFVPPSFSSIELEQLNKKNQWGGGGEDGTGGEGNFGFGFPHSVGPSSPSPLPSCFPSPFPSHSLPAASGIKRATAFAFPSFQPKYWISTVSGWKRRRRGGGGGGGGGWEGTSRVASAKKEGGNIYWPFLQPNQFIIFSSEMFS
jgi:hypothetical protein